VDKAAGKSKSLYFHRMLALTLWPCTTNEVGEEVEPFYVSRAWGPYYEVDHDNTRTKDCRSGNLFVYWWAYHRSKKRKRCLDCKVIPKYTLQQCQKYASPPRVESRGPDFYATIVAAVTFPVTFFSTVVVITMTGLNATFLVAIF
jgi:hypothetical protein